MRLKSLKLYSRRSAVGRSKMRRVGSIAAISLIIASAIYLADATDETQTKTQDIITQEPDVYGQEVTLNQLRRDGSLHYRLNTHEIRQYSDKNITHLKAPVLNLLSPTQPPWDISSGQGYIRKQGSNASAEDVVYLTDQVVMIQTHEVRGTTTIRASAFQIYPELEFAETTEAVMIDTDIGRTRSAGLRADLKSGVLFLSSNDTQRVHTIVLPEQFKKS